MTTGGGITRLEFLNIGAAAAAGWLLTPVRALAAQPQSDALARISRIIQDYDAQGIHRTGTDVDDASGAWLVEQARGAGARAKQERFHLSRVDVRACTVGGVGRTIEGLPLFDGGFTRSEGVTGRLGARASPREA